MSNHTHEDFISEARNKSKIIALIYSPGELHEYLVEIISQNSDTFIQKGADLVHFQSVDSALSHAVKYGVEEIFLCASTTYEEFGPESPAQAFEYIPICSKLK